MVTADRNRSRAKPLFVAALCASLSANLGVAQAGKEEEWRKKNLPGPEKIYGNKETNVPQGPPTSGPAPRPPSAQYAFSGRIIGGTYVEDARYRWIVSIGWKGEPPLAGHHCGGTILTRSWILTAAHCVDNGLKPTEFQITYGTNDLRKPGTPAEIDRIVCHPNWNRITYDNDIAMLRLATPLSSDRHISGLLENMRARTYVAGWGAESEAGGPAPRLKHLRVIPIDNSECNQPRAYDNALTSNMLCAGDGDNTVQNACQGDSGGPLMVHDRATGALKLLGLVSWGDGCLQQYKYMVYTRVNNYANNFIKSTVQTDQTSGTACP